MDIIKTLQIFSRPKRCLEAIGSTDLLTNIVYVGLDRMRAHAKFVSNLLICGPHRHMAKYLDFSLGKNGAICFQQAFFQKSLLNLVKASTIRLKENNLRSGIERYQEAANPARLEREMSDRTKTPNAQFKPQFSIPAV